MLHSSSLPSHAQETSEEAKNIQKLIIQLSSNSVFHMQLDHWRAEQFRKIFQNFLQNEVQGEEEHGLSYLYGRLDMLLWVQFPLHNPSEALPNKEYDTESGFNFDSLFQIQTEIEQLSDWHERIELKEVLKKTFRNNFVGQKIRNYQNTSDVMWNKIPMKWIRNNIPLNHGNKVQWIMSKLKTSIEKFGF